MAIVLFHDVKKRLIVIFLAINLFFCMLLVSEFGKKEETIMAKLDVEFSWQSVPQSSRNGFWKMLSVMLGFTFFSASMLAGGELGLGLTFTQFIVVVLIGNFVLGIYTGGLAYIAGDDEIGTTKSAIYRQNLHASKSFAKSERRTHSETVSGINLCAPRRYQAFD